MTTSLQYFRLVAPEFATELDATVNSWLDMAASFVDSAAYVNPELALALQAASLMLNAKNSANGQTAGGALVREKEGDLERQYAAPNSGEDDIYLAQLKKLGAATGIGYSAGITRMGDWVPSRG